MKRGDRVRVKIGAWLQKKNGLATRELTGKLEAVTEKGILFAGAAAIRESEYCLRCGTMIDHPISRLVGYGPECSKKLGIPRPEKLTLAIIEEVKARVEKETFFQSWLPRAYVEVEVLEAPGVAEPPVVAAPHEKSQRSWEDEF